MSVAVGKRGKAGTAILIVAGCAMLFPLGWMIVSSLKGSNIEIFEHPLRLPHQWTFSNYEAAWRQGRMGSYFLNSLWVSGISTVLVIYLGAWAGFALSKSSFPGRRMWMGAFLVGMILPVQSYLIPLMDLLEELRVHDSLWALILPYTAQNLPLAVLLFAAYFTAIPPELEEAARMDGAGTARFYFSILLPSAKPAVATVGVITALSAWNEFLMSLLFIMDPEMKTLPAGLIAFEQAHNTEYPALLSGLTLIAAPALVLYLFFNRQVMAGVMAGAVK